MLEMLRRRMTARMLGPGYGLVAAVLLERGLWFVTEPDGRGVKVRITPSAEEMAAIEARR